MSLSGPETEREIAGAETGHPTETELPLGEREKELDLFCSKNVLSQISLHEGKVPDPEQRQRPSVQREETLLSVSQVQVQVSLQVTQEAEEGVHNARHHAVCRDEEEETSEGQTGGQEVEQERRV